MTTNESDQVLRRFLHVLAADEIDEVKVKFNDLYEVWIAARMVLGYEPVACMHCGWDKDITMVDGFYLCVSCTIGLEAYRQAGKA
jgi:hypothetical protein